MTSFDLGVVLGFLVGAFQTALAITLLWLTGADERLVLWLEKVRDKMEDG